MSILSKKCGPLNSAPSLEETIPGESLPVITPDDVLRLNSITETYLCSPEANIYDIDFTRY